MKKELSILIIIFLFNCNTRSNTQISREELSSNKNSTSDTLIIDTSTTVHSSVTPFSGELYYKASWKDKLGLNIFIISQSINDQEEEGKAEVYAYHYTNIKDEWNLLWKTYDFVVGHGCDLSILPPKEFIKITDLDKNNLAEVAYFYKLDNRCDAVVVPAKMILHTNKNKFTIRGYANLYLGPPEDLMNKYLREEGKKEVKYKEVDENFNKLPESIKKYYLELWDKISK